MSLSLNAVLLMCVGVGGECECVACRARGVGNKLHCTFCIFISKHFSGLPTRFHNDHLRPQSPKLYILSTNQTVNLYRPLSLVTVWNLLGAYKHFMMSNIIGGQLHIGCLQCCGVWAAKQHNDWAQPFSKLGNGQNVEKRGGTNCQC